MSRNRRQKEPVSDNEDADAEPEPEDFGAHAAVQTHKGQLVQEIIPPELVEEMRVYGNNSKDGLWGPINFYVDNTEIKITKNRLANMDDEDVIKIIQYLLCAAGWNYNPVTNEEEKMFTGYATVHNLPKLKQKNDKSTTVTVNGKSVDHVISFNCTTPHNRQLYRTQAGDSELRDWCENAGTSAPMIAQLQTIMQVLMEKVPDPDAQYKEDKRKAAGALKTMKLYMSALYRAGTQVETLARKGQAGVEMEQKKHAVFERVKELHEELEADAREGKKANMMGSILGPALQKAYTEVEIAVRKIDRLADHGSNEAGTAPISSMSFERLSNLELEKRAKLAALKQYYTDARKHNEQVNFAFKSIAQEMMALDEHCRQSTWVAKSKEALEKAKSALLLKSSDSRLVANEVLQANSTTGSGISKVLTMAANFLGGHRIRPAASGDADGAASGHAHGAASGHADGAASGHAHGAASGHADGAASGHAHGAAKRKRVSSRDEPDSGSASGRSVRRGRSGGGGN